MTRVPAYTAAQVRAAEAPLLAVGQPLMRRAAAALADVLWQELPRGGRLLVLAGRGDNGGDALFAAGDSRVVAVDLPSGLQPDLGTVADDIVLPASVTVTFGALKAGLVRGAGPRLTGRVLLVDLGLALPADEAVDAGEVDIVRHP
ncbi:hypothetical protein H9651_10545 [Microbacterium sp. Sa4CUA7]|uniref:YjeF N-terminal domain-containing protein n=1 Tax=Microbacterium pullorum TaxID=2762236 RepID=A0ABR8S3M8_9MICO|nr:NAD(P)H-hydrate epimerase [Microbacterium pullorum]MBD7958078.1 hypothetical protein [Microbacterium pullorum]